MPYDQLFTVANTVALVAWIVLIIFPFRPFTNKLLIGVVVTALCLLYGILLSNMKEAVDFRSFTTLAGVQALLSTPGAALAGWIHYLAFDLMTGLFIANNAAKHGIHYGWVLPCLILCFMLGPTGLLLYLLLRWAITKYYFADNF